MSVDSTPRFSSEEAAHIAQQLFGLIAGVAPLPSERDQNFLLDVVGGDRYVLKIAKSDEDRGILEFQNAALRQVACRVPALVVPRVCTAVRGEDLAEISDRGGRAHYVRLLSWLEGQMLAEIQPHDDLLMASLGTTIAQVDRALLALCHPAMHRELHWNLRRANLALAHLPLLPAHQQPVILRMMHSWSEIDWRKLRQGIIHGDANDHNVLVREGRVVGLIDFGDLVHSAIACELAIALAYAMLAKPNPVQAGALVVGAYHTCFPLESAELDALYPLIGARLCMSVCYAAYNARAKSADAYQQVTAAPAWDLLQEWAMLSPGSVRAAWRRACGL